ncbi:MAG: hypothetical protein LBR94_05575 [Desulfovibrio sp.]|nr:hypothetical protein [Desulfovibrio sp.]
MPSEPSVDAALNIFAKPYRTALSVLPLPRCCDRHIDRVYLRFEPRGSRFARPRPTPSPHNSANGQLKARAILEKHFSGFVEWCRKQGNNLFAD